MTPTSAFDLATPQTSAAPAPVERLRAGARALGLRLAQAIRTHRTRRALMGLSDWQRLDCGLDGIDVRSACELERAARRRIELQMPADWS